MLRAPFARGLVALALASLASACPQWTRRRETPYPLKVPLGLGPVPTPQDNPLTLEKVELGQRLFYDRRLSAQPRSACADCHLPDHGFAGREAAQGFHRHVPTAQNRAYGTPEFWDGSAGDSLEAMTSSILRFLNARAKVPYWERLRRIPDYRRAFHLAFGRDPDEVSVAQAIASFNRTLLVGDSPYDRFAIGDKAAISPQAQRGATLFFGRAGCVACHAGPNFTDEAFHDLGIGQEEPLRRFYPPIEGKPDYPELGRFNVTHRLRDRGAFKTPTLRELVSHGPYMHAGQLGTLGDVVDYYDRGGTRVVGIDPRVRPLGLTAGEKGELVAFLRSLSAGAPPPPPPRLPPG